MAASRALSALLLRPPLAARSNSNRAAIGHLQRQRYGRLYPTLLVSTDGSTVRLRYGEPKRILMGCHTVSPRSHPVSPDAPGQQHAARSRAQGSPAPPLPQQA
ncbi:39S ribosomal protein L55, mitochondrial isoform X2 [Passer montanus]|uniref:39S ribosomal protein L55, mitochondrial isoform X2 n=1 Tax=Passer montanus TaxID=9160 RepID=UPI0019601D5E|nr:39S ribosomal protein L55, mitochondrial isoform X2 [Passer montanus]